MRAATALQLSDEPATRPPEESTNQIPQGIPSPKTNADQQSSDYVNQPHEHEDVDQQLTSEYLTIPDTTQPQTNEDIDQQLTSEYLTIPDTIQPQTNEEVDQQLTSEYLTIPDTIQPQTNEDIDQQLTSEYLTIPDTIQPQTNEEVDQQLTSEYLTIPDTIQPQPNADRHSTNPPHEYEVTDQQGENREQVNLEYATIPDIEKPYDLPLTGYMIPTTTGEYTQLTHTYENQPSVLQVETHAIN